MSMRLEFGATPAATISASANPVVNCGGASGVLIQCISTSSLTFTAQISADGTNYATGGVPVVAVADGAVTAAGSAVTPSAAGVYFVKTYGAEKLKLVRGAGSGTVSMRPVFAVDSVDAGSTSSLALLDDIVGNEYETVAASQTAQVLGATGATGDLINGLLIIPATTSPGNVLLLDNATSITIFAGGASSVTTLIPFFVPLGIKSVSGAWKVTTGANVSVIGVGNFT